MVSLIIPVYNSSLTIERCIRSVINQKYTSFEVIVIDDGSTDDSLQICHTLTIDDPRFKIIHQTNQGVSCARNVGIEVALGEYICFMDADDEIAPEYIGDLLNGINHCDLLIHGMVRIEGGKVIDRKMHIEGVFDLKKRAYFFFNSINIERYGGPYCKLYKKEIIERFNIRFNTTVRLAEDLDFLLRYLKCCSSVKTENKCNYYYYENSGSVTTRIYSFEEEFNILCALDFSWSDLCSRFPLDSLKILYKKSLSYYVTRIIPSIYRSGKTRYQRLACLRSIPSYCIDAYKQCYIPKTKYMSLIKFLLCKRMFVLFDIVATIRSL